MLKKTILAKYYLSSVGLSDTTVIQCVLSEYRGRVDGSSRDRYCKLCGPFRGFPSLISSSRPVH